ncbi:unnamed protein product [Closterium sp. Yama58-4]|nr:unnamed protein product [Closterium sp. Yama58-4]
MKDAKEILLAASDFFRDLFGKAKETSEEKWLTDESRRLDEKDREVLQAKWTEKEVKKALAELPKGKAPDQDGLPREFFESNWDILGPGLMRFIHSFEQSAKLPESLTTAVTILLHKKGEKEKLENYRPITLLNTVYKIVAKVLANRMKKVLRGPTQEIKKRKLGVRKQGKGELAYLGYADDTTLVLNGLAQVEKAGEVLKDFGEVSGLRINQEKTVLMPLGRNRRRKFRKQTPFKTAEPAQPERLLGVWITPNGEARPSWDKAFERVSSSLSRWAVQHLTTTARVAVINSYVMTVLLF